MNIVGVTACCSGIAHTYMAREALIMAAKALGHEIHVETQGTIGAENALTAEQIAAADVVILAVDVHIEGRERFVGKRVVEIRTDPVIKAPKALLKKIEQEIAKANESEANKQG